MVNSSDEVTLYEEEVSGERIAEESLEGAWPAAQEHAEAKAKTLTAGKKRLKLKRFAELLLVLSITLNISNISE